MNAPFRKKHHPKIKFHTKRNHFVPRIPKKISFLIDNYLETKDMTWIDETVWINVLSKSDTKLLTYGFIMNALNEFQIQNTSLKFLKKCDSWLILNFKISFIFFFSLPLQFLFCSRYLQVVRKKNSLTLTTTLSSIKLKIKFSTTTQMH